MGEEANDAAEPRRKRKYAPRKLTKVARETFLDHLAATAHVIQSCEAAGFGVNVAYQLRRRDAKFANEWRMALLAGYDRIEAALIRKALGCADHAPVVDSAATGALPGEGEVDVQVAMLLLARHKPTVERAARELKEEAFRATRDAAERTLLTKLRAHARQAGTGEKAASARLALTDGRAA